MIGNGLPAICSLALLAACGAHHPPAPKPTGADPGRVLFQRYCASCHLDVPGEAPPLAGSPWVTGPEHRLIRIALHGVRGVMEVSGKTFDREMPGFGQVLPDSDIASLLTYVRGRFGAPSGPVAEAQVSAIRAAGQGRTGYWSVTELLALP